MLNLVHIVVHVLLKLLGLSCEFPSDLVSEFNYFFLDQSVTIFLEVDPFGFAKLRKKKRSNEKMLELIRFCCRFGL